jgi:hypothetical protein
VCDRKASTVFYINIVLLQGSSLSLYLFIVFHCELINRVEAHTRCLFADNPLCTYQTTHLKKMSTNYRVPIKKTE